MISLVLLCALQGNIMLYAPEYQHLAEYNANVADVMMGMKLKLLPDTTCDSAVEKENLFVYGTPASTYYRQHFEDILPFRFHGDTVFVNDTMIVASDLIVDCQFEQPKGRNVEVVLSNDLEAASGGANLGSYDFVISRKRDGSMFEHDATCCGKLVWDNGKLRATGLKWYPHPERNLAVAISEHIKFYYDQVYFTQAEGARLLRLLNVEYDGYAKLYGIAMPGTVCVYCYVDTASSRHESAYDTPFGTIWLKVSDTSAFRHPARGSQLYTLAHEMAHIAFEGRTSRNPVRKGCEDWEDYAPMAGIIPYVHSVLGDTAWIVPEDYQQQGIPLFERFLHGAHETYAWLLCEVDRKYGKAVIGTAINQAVQSSWVRMGDMEQMMTSLGTLTRDTALSRRIAAGYPNPLSYSLVQDLDWLDFGFRPNLTAMSLADRFRVDSVQPKTQADSVGVKPGDTIVKIDGFDLDTQRGDCWRGFMFKKTGDPVTLTVRRKGKLRDLTLRVKKRV